MHNKTIKDNDIIDMLKQFKAMDEISGASKDFTSRVEDISTPTELSDDDLMMAAGGNNVPVESMDILKDS